MQNRQEREITCRTERDYWLSVFAGMGGNVVELEACDLSLRGLIDLVNGMAYLQRKYGKGGKAQ